MAELPAEADALYDERPDAFVAARNALVKTLRAQKRRDDAAVVAALRRPTPASWSLNQVARRSPDLVTAALDTVAALQKATARAVSGKRGDLRAAQSAQRAAVDAVLDAALQAARELGRGQADQLRRRAGATLHAVAADDELAARLRAGRLDDDVDAPGFGFGLGVPQRDDGEDEAVADVDTTAEDTAAAEAEARARAERAERDARLAELETEAERLEQVAAEAERAARQARARADAAAQAVQDARSSS